MAILTDTRHLHPREAVQALTQAVVTACGGDPRDDATVLCVDWHGGPTGERDASSGADREMRPHAAIERTEHRPRAVGPGWFALGARGAGRRHRGGRGDSVTFTGTTDEECETYFRGLGANLTLLGPGEPIGMAQLGGRPRRRISSSPERRCCSSRGR